MSTGTEAHAPTAGEYIVHHLTHLNSTGHAQTAIIDWSVWNLDTLFFSIGLGVVTLLLLMKAASTQIEKLYAIMRGRVPKARRDVIDLDYQV